MSEKYKTDGRLIVDNDGAYMGIFSAVSLLNDKIAKIKELEEKLAEYERQNTDSLNRIMSLKINFNVTDANLTKSEKKLAEAIEVIKKISNSGNQEHQWKMAEEFLAKVDA